MNVSEVQIMDIRYAVHPEHAASFGTDELRRHFLIQGLFRPGQINMTYSHYDRLIVGGVCPLSPVSLDVDETIIGTKYLLMRREMGVINIGGPGRLTVDGAAYEMDSRDGLYIAMGSREITFSGAKEQNPPKFYFNCAPAHAIHPTAKVTFAEAEPIHLGDMKQSNKRTIRKYIHPEGVASCQLVMGMTRLETGCVWNTMPVHTHQRRMEAYLYFDLAQEDMVFHFMGEPTETRHIVVCNEEAVLSPSWSIHSGAGTASYTFIWGMVGENQVFTDMDGIPMSTLR
jgi:4-deoxy-L-threo-5-hexosulose-uronate ketol-isomerase